MICLKLHSGHKEYLFFICYWKYNRLLIQNEEDPDPISSIRYRELIEMLITVKDIFNFYVIHRSCYV